MSVADHGESGHNRSVPSQSSLPPRAVDPADDHLPELSTFEREARLELALAIGEVGIWSWDLTTGSGDIDRRGAEIVGMEPGYLPDVAGAQQRRVHPDDLAALAEDVAAGIAAGNLFSLEYRVIHRDGRVSHVASRARVFRDAEGRPIRLLGTNRDVTSERELEAALRSREERYRTLFESMDEGFGILELIFDGDRCVDCRFVEVNPAFERHTGLRDPVGRTAGELFPIQDDRWLEMYGQVAMTGEPVRVRDEATGIGRTLDAYCFRVGDAEQRRVAVLVKDVTREVDAEREREAILERERLARSAAEAFLAVMSHELRTPVTSIYGTAALLARDPHRAELPELVKDIEDEADRLRRIIDDLLVLSGVDRGHIPLSPEPVLIQHAVREIIRDAERRFPAVTFETDVALDIAPITADTTALRQVLYNLVSNAAKYAGADGAVMISAIDRGDTVEVAVLDRGPGVGDDPDALFELFYRSPHTAQRASGTGIGLYVASQLSRAMDASITASNRDDGGAAFRVSLPKARED
jgi:PAS domain S-box-containing protein